MITNIRNLLNVYGLLRSDKTAALNATVAINKFGMSAVQRCSRFFSVVSLVAKAVVYSFWNRIPNTCADELSFEGQILD